MCDIMREGGFEFDGAFLFCDLGYRHGPFFSPRHYEEQLHPVFKELCDFFHERDMQVILHCCGNIKALIPYFIEEGIDCIQPLEVKAGMDLVELKEEFGDEMAYMGGIDVRLMSLEGDGGKGGRRLRLSQRPQRAQHRQLRAVQAGDGADIEVWGVQAMSDKQAILTRLRDALVELDIDAIPGICEEAMEAGISAYDAVIEGMAKGMEIVGEKYEGGEYYLAELVMAGETMKEGMAVLEPHLRAWDVKAAGRCVIGTVKGDLHDIGKNVFVTLLKAQNYEVIDLGVDVSPQQFIEAVRERRPDVLAMSALLTTTMTEMGAVIVGLEKYGLRDGLKVIIGGAPSTEEYAREIGADATAKDAVEGVRIVTQWSRE